MIDYGSFVIQQIMKGHLKPRIGVEIPYLKKYLTYNDPFFSSVIGKRSWTRNATYDYRVNTGTANYTMHDGLGYHLIGDDGTDYGEILKIYRHPETFVGYIDVDHSVVLPSGTNDYHIAKYYESIIMEAPVLSEDTIITGGFGADTEVSLKVSNANGNDYVKLVCDFHSGKNIIEALSGTPIKSDIGSKIIIDDSPATVPTGWQMEAIIKDVEDNIIYLDRDIPNYITSLTGVTVFRRKAFTAILKDLPDYIEKAARIVAFINPTDIPYSDSCLKIFTGRIHNITNKTMESFDLILRGNNVITSNGKIGQLISRDDDYIYPYLSTKAVGKMKPILFGDFTYNNIGSYLEPVFQTKKLAKCVYLGNVYDGGNYALFLVAGHDVSATSLYVKNSAGRYNQISSSVTFVTIGNDTIAKVSITSVDDKASFVVKDYYYPNGNSVEVIGGGMSNINYAADSNPSTQATLFAENTPGGTEGGLFNVLFNDYDLDEVEDDDILNVTVKARAKIETSNDPHPPSNGAYFKINDQEVNNYDTAYYNDDYDYLYSTFTRAHIKEAVPVELYGGMYAGIDMSYLGYVCNLVKAIDYRVHGDFNEIEVIASCTGYEYGTWIDNRKAGKANANGGTLQHTHADCDDSGVFIQNPLGIIEAIIRDTNFGCSGGDSDINLDTFNRASIGGRNNVLYLSEQTELYTLIEQICFENNLTIGEDENGRIKVYAYNTANEKTYQNFDLDGLDDSILLGGDTLDAGESFIIICSIFSNLVNKPLLGQSAIFNFPAIRAALSNFRVVDGLGNYVEWTSIDELSDWDNFHVYEIKNLGSNDWELFVDGISKGVKTGTFDTISYRYLGRAGTDFLKGKIRYAAITDGINYKLNLCVKDGLPYDMAGESISYNGSYSEDKIGICADRAIPVDYGYTPIIDGSFLMIDDVSQIYTKLNQYYEEDNDGRFCDYLTLSDTTTIGKTIEETHMLSLLTEGITTRGNLLLNIHARKMQLCEFTVMSSGLLFSVHDTISIITREIEEEYSSIENLKWLVIGTEKSLDGLTTKITALLYND